MRFSLIRQHNECNCVPNGEACHCYTKKSQVEIRIHGGTELVLIQLKRVSFCSSGVGPFTLCVTVLDSIKVMINPNMSNNENTKSCFGGCKIGRMKLVLIQSKRVSFCSCGACLSSLSVTGLYLIKVMIKPEIVVQR